MKTHRLSVPMGVILVTLGSASGVFWSFSKSNFALEPIVPQPIPTKIQAPAFIIPPITKLGMALQDAQSRPLFSEKRRERIEIEEVAQVDDRDMTASQSPPPDYIKFIGFLSQGDNLAGLFRNEQNGEEVWIALGGKFNDWTLTELSQVAAKFTLRESSYTTELFP